MQTVKASRNKWVNDSNLIGEDRHCGRYTDPELWCLREPYEMFYCPYFTLSNLSICALLIHAQLAWAIYGHITVNSSRYTFIMQPHVKMCPVVSIFIYWILCLTGPSLVEKGPVGITQGRDEPCLPKLSRTRQDTEAPVSIVKLSCQSALAISANDRPDVPMVTDSHNQTSNTSQYTAPGFFFPVTVSSSNHTHGAGGSFFDRSCTEVLKEPCVRG